MNGLPITSIEVIIGPMFSGKTEKLIRRIRSARNFGYKVQVFFPAIDTRPKKPKIQSHGGANLAATPIKTPQEILSCLEEDTSIVVIDEIQFLDPSLIVVCNSLVYKGIHVILAGLDRDFRGETFETVASIISQIKVDRLRATCTVCKKLADYSQRIINGQPAPYDSPLFMVGGSELYEPRCEDHYFVPGRPQNIKGFEINQVDIKSQDLLGIVDVTRQLDQWIDKIQAIARTGLGYTAFDTSNNEWLYHKERYEELLMMASEMKSFLLNRQLQLDKVLISQYYEDWRTQVQPGQRGYITPKVTAFGAIFDNQNKILLVNKKNSPFWDLPGGWCDIGYSAAENAVKEIKEETGYEAKPLRLIGIYDSQRWGFLSQTQLYTLVFYCLLEGGELCLHPLEIEDAHFFDEEELPSLLPGSKLSILHAFAYHREKFAEPFFDFRVS